jgi:hypothetical protein
MKRQYKYMNIKIIEAVLRDPSNTEKSSLNTCITEYAINFQQLL